MATDFFNIGYLKNGSEIQQEGFAVLEKTNILELLKSFDAVLAGTLPLDIFIAGSDLDILCYALDLTLFESYIVKHFSHHTGFMIDRSTVNGIESVISEFHVSGFDFEIFGQSIPTRKQTAYQHLIIEEKILTLNGAEFRNQIIALKKSGLKTEPAFAQLLGLEGNPYDALLRLTL
ncbi:MAG: DUF4269 domain-containing protein [Cyclobacteriaceae bacterium]